MAEDENFYPPVTTPSGDVALELGMEKHTEDKLNQNAFEKLLEEEEYLKQSGKIETPNELNQKLSTEFLVNCDTVANTSSDTLLTDAKVALTQSETKLERHDVSKTNLLDNNSSQNVHDSIGTNAIESNYDLTAESSADLSDSIIHSCEGINISSTEMSQNEATIIPELLDDDALQLNKKSLSSECIHDLPTPPIHSPVNISPLQSNDDIEQEKTKEISDKDISIQLYENTFQNTTPVKPILKESTEATMPQMASYNASKLECEADNKTSKSRSKKSAWGKITHFFSHKTGSNKNRKDDNTIFTASQHISPITATDVQPSISTPPYMTVQPAVHNRPLFSNFKLGLTVPKPKTQRKDNVKNSNSLGTEDPCSSSIIDCDIPNCNRKSHLQEEEIRQ